MSKLETPSPTPPGPTSTAAVNDRLQDPPHVLYGWRLHLTALGLALSLFFSALETTIVATALTTIADAFSDFASVGWVVTAYLVTYSSFLLAHSKLADIFGQKACLVGSLGWFALFSGLCGGAHSMSLPALIVFRALQGIGGSGIYSAVFIIIVNICPARLVGVYSAAIASTFAMANVLGPIIGGAICASGHWEWIFLLNVPGAIIAMAILVVAMPGNPSHKLDLSNLRRLDFVGALLSVGCAVLLLYALQTGGVEHAWYSAQIVGTLVAGVVGILLFFAWEMYCQHRETRGSTTPEPLFPLRLLRNPRIVVLLLSTFFQGAVFYAAVVNTPQVNQIVHLMPDTLAGVRTLAILLPMTFCTFLSGAILGRSLRPAWYLLLTGCAVMVLGAGLLVEVPFATRVPVRNYVYEVVLGVGMGLTMSIYILLGRVESQDRDNAVVLGGINMMRTMGGCISLSAFQTIIHSRLPGRLASVVPGYVVAEIVSSPTTAIRKLSTEQSLVVRERYHDVYRTAFIMVAALGAVALVVSSVPVFLRRRKSRGTGGDV